MDGQLILSCSSFAYSVDPEPVSWPKGEAMPPICGIAVKGGKLYLANRSLLYPVAVFSEDGQFISGFGRECCFVRSHGLWVDDDGSLFVCDDGRHVIYHFSAEQEIISTLGTLDKPSDNGYDPTVPWPHDLYTITRAGEPFNRPTDIIRAADGRLYVADGYGNTAVHRFSGDEKHELTWGGPGKENGQFRLPHTLCEDGKHRIWVCDRENHRIQIFTTDGEFIHGIERMDMPSECWCDGKYMYVIEGFGFLSIYDFDYRRVARMGYPQSLLSGAHSIAGDEHGNLYVGFINGPYKLIRLNRL